MFSKNAVICQRNGSLYLQFRVGNLRDSTLLESHVRAVMVRHVSGTLLLLLNLFPPCR